MATNLQAQFVVRISYLFICMSVFLLSGCGGDSDVAPTTDSSDSTSFDVPSEEGSSDESDVSVVPAVADSSTDTPSEPAAAARASHVSQGSPEPAEKLVETTPTEADAPLKPPGPEKTSAPAATGPNAATELESQLAAFTIPPAWLATVQPRWSITKPWKEGRKEIRRLLGTGNETDRREGIRLTWDYLQKDDIGDGHEYGMYMFLGNEPLWAVHVYREWLARTDHSYPPYFGIKALASLYAGYGLFEEAEDVLNDGVKYSPPDAKWIEVRKAEMHDAFGDLYAAWGKTDQATGSYQEAIRLFPLGKPPYGRHLLPRKAKKVQSKLDLLSKASLEGTSLRDGNYNETTLGYSGDIQLAVEVKGGRIATVAVTKHQEKIDQNACVLIPQRIGDKRSLQVDGISGATVTKDAIVDGTFRALKKAGLR